MMTRHDFSRRDLIRHAVAGISPLALLGQQRSGTATPRPQRPNIVVILADDLGYGDLSCYGATKLRTPNIDSLATQGVRFSDAHSPSSICSPSRYGLLTGRYCWRTWLKRSALATTAPLLIEDGRTTLASLLKSVGYHTECIGKWHLGFDREEGYAQDKIDEKGNFTPVGYPPWWESKKGGPPWNGDLRPGPLEVGFDYYFGIPIVNSFPPYVYVENHKVVNLRKDDPIGKMESKNYGRMEGGATARWKDEDLAFTLTAKVVSSIESQRKDQPFFLCFAPHQPHIPYRPNGRFKASSGCGERCDVIQELDWSVGEILDALQRAGFADNTLVVFSSDNGAPQGSLGAGLKQNASSDELLPNGPVWRGGKGSIWEGGHRVPFLARWPGRIAPGSRSEDMICLTDLLATFAAITGVNLRPEDGPDSFNMLPALLGQKSGKPLRGPLVMGCDSGMHAIREGPWKLLLGQGGGGFDSGSQKLSESKKSDSGEPPLQLYNLEKDPGEKLNVYDSHPDIVRRLQDVLETFKSEGRSRPP